MIAAALAVLAFVLGSVPTGLLIARRRGVDLRAIGSGNIGATNVKRALGTKWSLAVLVVDAFKGLLPVLAARGLGFSPWETTAVALASVYGHCLSIFLKGRGGKGVSTSLGAAIVIAPRAALGAALVHAVLFALWRYSSVGSLVAVMSFTGFLWLGGERHPALYAFGILAGGLVVIRHKDNIRRLLRGEEFKA